MRPYERFEIVELDEFSGSGATIYSICLDNDDNTLYDHFLAEHQESFRAELKDIQKRLTAIAKLGVRAGYVTDKEGSLGAGDGVVALCDDPDKHLRLYGIQFGQAILIVGGGGHKPKEVDGKWVRAFQDIPKLKDENYLLRALSARINQAQRDGDLAIDWRSNRLTGNLSFGPDEED